MVAGDDFRLAQMGAVRTRSTSYGGAALVAGKILNWPISTNEAWHSFAGGILAWPHSKTVSWHREDSAFWVTRWRQPPVATTTGIWFDDIRMGYRLMLGAVCSRRGAADQGAIPDLIA